MERKELAAEISDFCNSYRIFDDSGKTSVSAEKIDEQLKEIWFVEHLIHMFIIKARYRKNMNIPKLKELLLELEKIRLDLEYYE